MGFRAKLLDEASGFLEPGLDAGRARLVRHAPRRYVRGDLDDPDTYARLARASSIGSALGHALFYLAVPPALFAPIAKGLGAAGLNQGTVPGSSEPAWRRIVVEKPFGRDLASARRAEPGAGVGVRRAADLPDRSLPRARRPSRT